MSSCCKPRAPAPHAVLLGLLLSLPVVAQEVPAPPDTPSPADGATGIRPWIPLRWRAATGTARHDVSLWRDGDAEPAAPSISVKGARAAARPTDGLGFGVSYRWRVRVVATSGRSVLGPVWTFTTATRDAAVPLPPFPVTPAAEAARARSYLVTGIDALVGPDTPLRKSLKIAWFGDSITDVTRYQRFVEEAVGRSPHTRGLDVRFLNRGLNGGKAEDLVRGVRRWGAGGGPEKPLPFEKQLEVDAPDVVVLFIGVNEPNHLKAGAYPAGAVEYDSPPTPVAAFEESVRTLVETARRRGARVVLGTPAVHGERPDGSNARDARLDAYAAACRRVAADTDVTFVPVRTACIGWLRNHNVRIAADGKVEVLRDRGLLTGDGVHPNARGSRLLSELFADGIRRALDRKAGKTP